MLDTWLVCNGHKGVNQQGNKSLLSFRTGYGQPGYTGYIPAIDAIPYSVRSFPPCTHAAPTSFHRAPHTATI